MPYAEYDELSIYYQQEGRGYPPFVFIHGWCCNHAFFQPQFEHFKSKNKVTAVDLRGCGKSNQPEEGYDIPSLADDIAWLCGELKITSPIFIGHSLGGMIGIEIAARYPSLPAAIIAVDPGPIYPTQRALRFYEGFAMQLEGPDGEAVREAYIEHICSPTDDNDRKRWISEVMGSVPLGIAAAMIRGIVSWNGVAAFQLCQAPLLVLLAKTGGSNDPSRLLSLNPDVHIGVTVGAGHFNQFEVPEQVNLMIERFLQVTLKEPAD